MLEGFSKVYQNDTYLTEIEALRKRKGLKRVNFGLQIGLPFLSLKVSKEFDPVYDANKITESLLSQESSYTTGEIVSLLEQEKMTEDTIVFSINTSPIEIFGLFDIPEGDLALVSKGSFFRESENMEYLDRKSFRLGWSIEVESIEEYYALKLLFDDNAIKTPAKGVYHDYVPRIFEAYDKYQVAFLGVIVQTADPYRGVHFPLLAPPARRLEAKLDTGIEYSGIPIHPIQPDGVEISKAVVVLAAWVRRSVFVTSRDDKRTEVIEHLFTNAPKYLN